LKRAITNKWLFQIFCKRLPGKLEIRKTIINNIEYTLFIWYTI